MIKIINSSSPDLDILEFALFGSSIIVDCKSCFGWRTRRLVPNWGPITKQLYFSFILFFLKILPAIISYIYEQGSVKRIAFVNLGIAMFILWQCDSPRRKTLYSLSFFRI
jgi:hypothetical protein